MRSGARRRDAARTAAIRARHGLAAESGHILSNEVGLRNVLTRLIAIVRENAGAQVARLLLLSDGAYHVEAEIDGDAITVLQSRQLDLDAASDPQFPLSLLRYVMRTGVEVIEDSITGLSRFAADPYVRQRAALRDVPADPARRPDRRHPVLRKHAGRCLVYATNA